MDELNNDTTEANWSFKHGASVYVVNLVLGITFNIVFLIVIHRQRNLQDVMKLLYRMLAIACLINGISWNCWSLLWFAVKGRHLCSLITLIFMFPTRLTFVLIMACLCGINVNKYFLITRPLRYHAIVTPRRVKVTFASSLIAVLVFSGCNFPVPASPVTQQDIEDCVIKSIVLKYRLGKLLSVIGYIVPINISFFLLLGIYINLVRILRRQRKAVDNLEMHAAPGDPFDGSNLQGHWKQPGLRGRFKGIFTVALLSISFLAVWAPLCVAYLFPRASTGNWLNVMDKMATTVCWVQPLVYLTTTKEAKKHCIDLIRHCVHFNWA
ncbi:beta-2 adrenergic receptor-like [Lytechinus variegatus]|uniref:beta-2 adrenergic receptor-like n=1 Tax=Lytechinus variegatus TaxID=7654 RepID=UPI001BB0F4EF|nr:beta-2 adrenergic receptor-like [Lytechinus variegatus]